MKIALFGMPDSASSFDNVMRMPNLGLASIAACVPDHHEIEIYDLVVAPRGVAARVRGILCATRPDLVGLSAMSFQFASAVRIARIVREVLPKARVVLGGYHATVQYEEVLRDHGDLFDFVVRGEGEETFRELVATLATADPSFDSIEGLSFRAPDGTDRHNPARALLDVRSLPAPRRSARRLEGFTYFGRRFDCVETSRGCTYPCTFCSIRSMYGKTFRAREIPDVVAEVTALKDAGVEGVFFVDDNIVLDAGRFKRLCAALAEAGTGGMELIVQASVPAIAHDPEVARLMSRAGIRLVFMGVESGSAKSLGYYKKKEINRDVERAVANLRANEILVVGGLIVGNPDDTAEDVRATFRYAKEIGLDHAILLSLQPYPRTEIRAALVAEGLVTNLDDFSRYNGFIVNVRTRHLSTTRLARLVATESVKLYLSPYYLTNSRLVSRYRPFLGRFLKNGLDSLVGGWRNRMFETTSTF